MYNRTFWVDETDQYENRYREVANDDGTITHTKVTGEVYVEGTPQSARNFNNIEAGILDAHGAAQQILVNQRQHLWRIEDLEKATDQETGSVTLTNSKAFPFNNSQKSVAMGNRRDNLNYVVEIISVTPVGGPYGEIDISDRLVNGFKIAFTGSASSVTVTYAVIGGYNR